MDLFSVIGPIMIGPSSSHTAGAARIGRIVRRLMGADVQKAEIFFHGSFAKTWKGHGTDRAVVGGLLDMGVSDVRLRESLEIALERGMVYSFSAISLRDAHPNTVLIHASAENKHTLAVQAASVGGGNIRIQSIDGLRVDFSGDENTLIVFHRDTRGAITEATGILSRSGVNIATMHVFRKTAGGQAIMVLELDALPDAHTIQMLSAMPVVDHVVLLDKIA